MAGVEGFEPPTIGFGDRCSTNWNYTPKNSTQISETKQTIQHANFNYTNFVETFIFREKF
jgi:hypothetical protein